MTGLVDPGRSRRSPGRLRDTDDGSLPPAGALAKLLARSVLLPVAVWLAVLIGCGYLLSHTLKHAVSGEDAVNRTLAHDRTPGWNEATNVMSHFGNTGTIIITMLAASLVIWLISRRLREPVALIVGVSCQALVFLLTTLAIARPRPAVPHLDRSPPTSSFPSGHTGASSALYFGLVIVCVARLQRTWLRVATAVVFGVIPFGVATARLYRGMHHPTDVTFGMLNGLICAVIAWTAFHSARD